MCFLLLLVGIYVECNYNRQHMQCTAERQELQCSTLKVHARCSQGMCSLELKLLVVMPYALSIYLKPDFEMVCSSTYMLITATTVHVYMYMHCTLCTFLIL